MHCKHLQNQPWTQPADEHRVLGLELDGTENGSTITRPRDGTRVIPILLYAFVSSSLLACPGAAQLVFEPQLLDAAAGGNYAPRVDLGDVDLDGDTDAVAATNFDGFLGYEVLLNDGTGELQTSSQVSTSDELSSVQLLDFDADGKHDLLSAGGDALRLRRGLAGALFGDAEVLVTSAGGTLNRFLAAEFTGDTLPDVLALERHRIVFLPGKPGGTVGPALADVDVAPLIPYAARIGNLDGVGPPDLIVLAHDLPGPPSPTGVALALLVAPGGSITVQSVDRIGLNLDAELAELTGDGLPDLATASSSGVELRPGKGGGFFGAAIVLDRHAFETGITLGDFDSDGHLDIAAVEVSTGELVFWRGNGTGAFVENLRVSGADPFQGEPEPPDGLRPLKAAEMNEDGRTDVVRTAGDVFGRILLHVFRNHTYASDSSFFDLGHWLADPGFGMGSSDGIPGLLLATPILLADGGMQGGEDVSFRVLRHGVEPDHAWLVVGTSALSAPFHGGTLVPAPTFLVGPIVLPGFNGEATLETTVPAGLPPGTQLWMQAWFMPANQFEDYSSTSALRITAP